jgi:hypothetical protein
VSINATLIAQLIVFLILVWFTMKFVWPPIVKALDERAQKIADGLSAADKAKSELSLANKRVEEQLTAARNETAQRLADAERLAQSPVVLVPVMRGQPRELTFSQKGRLAVPDPGDGGDVSVEFRCHERRPAALLEPCAEPLDRAGRLLECLLERRALLV